MKTRIITTIIAVLFGLQVYAQNVKRPDSYYYNRGVELYLDEGKGVDAYDYFENELSDNPKNGYAHLWKGCILYDNELYGDALTSIDKAISLIPSKDKEYLCFAYQKKGDVYAAMEDNDDALTCYTKAIKALPNEARAYERRAEMYYLIEKYDLSDKDFDKIIELNPSGYSGYMGKGRNAKMQGKYEDAIKLFDQVVKMHGKDYAQCYSFRAEAYIGLGQYEKAADDIISALIIGGENKAFYLIQNVMADSAAMTMVSKLKIQQLKEPNNVQWPYYIGAIYEQNKNYEKAIEYFTKSNSINASDVTSSRLALCYQEMGNYIEALKHIEDAIQMAPSDTRYKAFKADFEYDSGLFEEALADINTCIMEVPEFFYFHHRKGFYENNLGMTDDAIEDYTTAIMLNPDYAYSYLGRGDMYIRKGMTQEAQKDFQRIIEIDTVPNSSSCAQYAYLALGNREKAIEYMDRILDSFPDDKGNYFEAACLYARIGDKTKSLGYLETALEKGYFRFAHFDIDDDLDILRDTEEYKALIAKYKEKAVTESVPTTNKEEISVEIPYTKTNGVTEVQCSINGLPLHFVFDTGASDVTISMIEATFMLKNKYLKPLDVVGKQNYLTADGNVSEGTVINLKSVKIGDLELTNVRASVVKSQNAPLLLGQSVLGRLGKIEIDNEKRVIKVTNKE